MQAPTIMEESPSDISLDETVQVAAFASGNPETPTPAADDTALLRILGELAHYRQEHGVAPVGVLVNPLTALEVVLATHNWNHVFDPSDLSAIPLSGLPGLAPDAVQFIPPETAQEFVSQC